MKKFVCVALAAMTGVGQLCAVDLMPWYSNALELNTELLYTLQNYRKVETECGHHKYRSNDSFVTLSIGTSFEPYAIDMEITGANTRHHHTYFDDFALTARYQWLDDVIGDYVSLVTGVTMIAATDIGKRDISNFFHGNIEGEFHVSVGREMTCFDTWSSRWWAVGGIGIADVGSPWVRGDAAYEMTLTSVDVLRLYANTLWGLGGDRLCLCHRFHGYGPINHQSVDIGMALFHDFECGGTAQLAYSARVWAKNCPMQVNLVTVSFQYPFGL